MTLSSGAFPAIRFRAAQMDDLSTVATLFTPHVKGLSEDTLRQRWTLPDWDMSQQTCVAVLKEGLAPIGYAHLLNLGKGLCMPYAVVTPEYRYRGLGAALLKKMEFAALKLVGDDGCLISRIDHDNAGGRRLAERSGFAYQMTFQIMEISFSNEAPPQPTWPDDITCRTFVPGQDERATYEADEEASADKSYYEPKSFEAWTERMELHTSSFDPSMWFLACSGNDIAAVSLSLLREQTGWIEHLGVRPAYRRQGLGESLLLQSFGDFYRRGIKRVRLSVESDSPTGAERLYERVGMQVADAYHIYEKPLSTPDG